MSASEKSLKEKMPSRGKRLTFSALPIKKVAPGAIAPPEELIASDLTTVVPTMFASRKPQQTRKAAPPPKQKDTPKTVSFSTTQAALIEAAPEPAIVSVAAPTDIDSVFEAVPAPTEVPAAPTELPAAPAEPSTAPAEVPKRKSITLRRPKKKYSDALEKVKSVIQTQEQTSPYKEEPEAFVPQDRKGFLSFIVKHYSDFSLPPRLEAPDLEACQKIGAAGEDTTKMYLYQQFVREYIRQASPYRGLLVYHGLGSGKTCSAIAAMEALYGTSDKKIIVMTPFSLQNNFLTEITFCGFRHFRLQNHWVRVELESDPTASLFAKEVMKIPQTFFDKQKRSKKPAAFYVPDFEKPSNFDSLEDDEKATIREQIFSILRSRITFISYNGIRASQLKVWACSEPDFFDNAVIVIDEVHNLTRLMQGTIEPYLTTKPGQKRRIEAEPITPGRWKPKLCNVSSNYKRAFLFYRLLTGAKNSKIIALSGTPLVNFPEELGILANVLHGYIDSVTAQIPVKAEVPSKRVESVFISVVSKHPRVDFYKIVQTQSAQQIFFSAVQDGYIKVFDEGGKLKGLEYVAERATPASIQDIYAEITSELAAQGITVTNPSFEALPLLPPDGETFEADFIDAGSLKIRNEIVLSKRLSGLISFYRGSKVEFMPRVIRDEYVNVPFSDYSLVGYLKARRAEQEKEEQKKTEGGKTKVVAAWSEVLAIAKKKNPSSYRFRSRAACNFVFPESVPRPFPDNEFDIEEELGKDVEVLGDQEADVADDDAASQAAAEEDAAIDAEEGAATATAPAAAPKEGMTYKQRIAAAIEALRAIGSQHLVLKPSEPGKPSLEKYSPKYAEILRRIQASNGSALVYSQFRTLEGIGLFGVALEANGYIPIEILGSDADPYFSPRTEQSLRAHFEVKPVVAAEPLAESIVTEPNAEESNAEESNAEESNAVESNAVEPIVTEQNAEESNAEESNAEESNSNTVISENSQESPPNNQTGGAIAKNRYILYSGEESRERRNLLINLFNARFDRLPPRIAQVLRESGFEGPTNKKGDICKVISITGAGAEGLSLKNVRSVHIMEPFWNPVRTDQVKGRAVRICSHAELPVEERTVEVFTYVASVSQEMVDKRLVDQSFFILDGGHTSDQFIQGISEAKKKVSDDILRVMKQSAVDCTLNSSENNTPEETIQCFRIKGTNDEFLYDPRINDDIVETERSSRFATTTAAEAAPLSVAATAAPSKPKTEALTIILIKGKQYAARPDADGSFALYDVKDKLFERKLGTRRLDPLTGKYKSTFVA